MPRKVSQAIVKEEPVQAMEVEVSGGGGGDPNAMESHIVTSPMLLKFVKKIVESLLADKEAAALLEFRPELGAVQKFDLLHGTTGMPVKRESAGELVQAIKYRVSPVFDGPFPQEFSLWTAIGSVWGSYFHVNVKPDGDEYDIVITVCPKLHAMDEKRAEVLGSFEGSYDRGSVDREIACLKSGEAGGYADGVVARLVELAREHLDLDKTEELRYIGVMRRLCDSEAAQALKGEMERRLNWQTAGEGRGERYVASLHDVMNGTIPVSESEKIIVEASLKYKKLKDLDEQKRAAAAAAAAAATAAAAAAAEAATAAAAAARASASSSRASAGATRDRLVKKLEERVAVAVKLASAAGAAAGAAAKAAATAAPAIGAAVGAAVGCGGGLDVKKMLEQSSELLSSVPCRGVRHAAAAGSGGGSAAGSSGGSAASRAVESAMETEVDLRACVEQRMEVEEQAGGSPAAAASQKGGKKDKKKKK